MRFRRPIALLASLVLLTSVYVAAPTPAAAATPCYYGAWQEANQGYFSTSLNFRVDTVVRYRVGYTCGGSQMSNWQMDWRKMWISTGVGTTGEYTGTWARDWTVWNVFNSSTHRLRATNPGTAACWQDQCSWYRYDGADLYGNSWDPFITAVCTHCTASSWGDMGITHWFRTRDLDVVVGVPTVGH